MTRLFVIDDHFLTIEGWWKTFDHDESKIEMTGSASCIIHAITKLECLNNVDIIILGLFLKRSDPISNIKTLRKEFPRIPIISISFETSYEWQVEMFRHGAWAFLDKGDTKESITSIIHQVAAGYKVVPAVVDDLLRMKTPRLEICSTTLNENDIISDLKNGLSIKEIAVKHSLSPSSIEKTLNNFRHLLGVKTNCEMLYRLMKKNQS